MRYRSAAAFRAALADALRERSESTDVSLNRLRRRVVVERLMARIVQAEPDRWVLKGGMALEVRLGDRARLTKDVDLGLRDDVETAVDLRERLTDALAVPAGDDAFELLASGGKRLQIDRAGSATWRVKVDARLAGKPFDRVQVDVSPRAQELETTERLLMPGTLTFADIPAPTVEVIDVNRHVAEKFHAMLRDYGDRENSRVRDLVDVVTLHEHGLINPRRAAAAIRAVWAERDRTTPPTAFPSLPPSWADRYPTLIAEHPLGADTFPEAAQVAADLWHTMSPNEEA